MFWHYNAILREHTGLKLSASGPVASVVAQLHLQRLISCRAYVNLGCEKTWNSMWQYIQISIDDKLQNIMNTLYQNVNKKLDSHKPYTSRSNAANEAEQQLKQWVHWQITSNWCAPRGWHCNAKTCRSRIQIWMNNECAFGWADIVI
jgi:hypothetical protein